MVHILRSFDGARAHEDSEIVSQPQVFARGQMLRIMTSPSSLTVKALGTAQAPHFHARVTSMVKNSEIQNRTVFALE
jgi:hypothetical protein